MVPDEKVVVKRPDIVIIEGLNVLQPARVREDGRTGLALSDFFDFSVYVDAGTGDIRDWYVERFLRLRETAFRDPASYFAKYAALTDEEAVAEAERIWDTINGPNLAQNILPTRSPRHPGAAQGPRPLGALRAAAQALSRRALRARHDDARPPPDVPGTGGRRAQGGGAAQAPTPFTVTGTLPRVALEYGHTWWAASTSSCAGASSTPGMRGDDVHGDRERLALGAEAHGGLDDRLGGVHACLLRDEAERPREAGAVADGEELLGVGAGARAAGRLGRASGRGRGCRRPTSRARRGRR